jgi:hypothetical protein
VAHPDSSKLANDANKRVAATAKTASAGNRICRSLVLDDRRAARYYNFRKSCKTDSPIHGGQHRRCEATCAPKTGGSAPPTTIPVYQWCHRTSRVRSDDERICRATAPRA